MTAADDPELEDWLRRAGNGDRAAVGILLERYRDRLRRMIGPRLNDRVEARLDASDVVQETLMDAAQRLESYVRDRPLPFYPWLYRLARERLAQVHRHHLRAERRQADRECHGADGLAGRDLVDALAASGTSPSGGAIREEDRAAIRRALGELSEPDRDVLTMRYVDQLTFAEIAAILGITGGAARLRHYRALRRIGPLLGMTNGGPEA